jgi:hypothetical protein
MRRPYIPFFASLALMLVTIPFSFDLATSAVPGWHTTVFPPYFIWIIIPPYFIWIIVVVVVLHLITIGYWMLSKRADKINWILFAIHFALTVPSVIYLRFPTMLLDVQRTDQEELIKALAFRMSLIPVFWTLFIIGQIIFLVYYTRKIKTASITS